MPVACPVALPGFEHVQRAWDPEQARWTARLMPGEYYVTTHDEAITTVLGSCIAACVRDPVLRIGGMNHFMLPDDAAGGRGGWLEQQVGRAARYGTYAMESLINGLLKCGARRDRLEVKLFGGGNILSAHAHIGARNIEFAHAFLRVEGLTVLAEDVGEGYPRRVVYFPVSGRALVRRLSSLDHRELAARERHHLVRLDRSAGGNDVEMFG